jgi:hypothetical protein
MFLLRQAGEGRRLLGLLRVWVLVLTPHFFGTPVANAEQVNTRPPEAARLRCAAQADRDHMVESPQTVYVRVCGWRKIASSLTSNERRTTTTMSARADEGRVWHAPAALTGAPRAVAQMPRTPY